MKAKHIRKIKSKMIPFLVLRSHGMFGEFAYGREPFCTPVPLNHYTEVMARNPKEAAKRFMKRTHCTSDLNRWDRIPEETSSSFGLLKILPKNKPYQRFVTYWH